jgi:Bacterial Ig-like domain
MRRWLPATLLLVLAATLTACPPAAVKKPVVSKFTATPATINGSGTDVINLAWTVTDATDINIKSNNIDATITLADGTNPTTATAKGMKTETIFTLTATNGTEVTTATTTVKVVATPAPSITTFQVKTGAGSPGSSVNVGPAGGSVTFNWTVSNATGLSIDNAVGPVTPLTTGTKVVAVPVGTTPVVYTLTATNTNGTAPDTATVTVNRSTTDTIAPTLDSSLPDTGTGGVDKAANIVVTFSEAMNQAATEAAYSSANTEIAPANVAFSWNGAGTVLTINPNGDLLYDAITDPNGLAKVYTYSFGAGATDLAGNALAAASQTNRTFKTLRDITQTITASAALSGEVVYSVTPAGNKYFASDIEVGDTDATVGVDIGANYAWKGFAGFDLTGVPAAVVADPSKLLAASVKLKQYQITGTPYGPPVAASLGTIKLEHITYPGATGLNDAIGRSEAYSGAALADLGAFSIDATIADKSLSALAAVKDDLTNKVARLNRSTYRLRFTTATNTNGVADHADFDGPATANTGPRLVLNYILP